MTRAYGEYVVGGIFGGQHRLHLMRIHRLDLAEAAVYRATAIPVWQAAYAHTLPDVLVPDAAQLLPDAAEGHRTVLGAFEASKDSDSAIAGVSAVSAASAVSAIGVSVINPAKTIAPAFWVAPDRRRRGIGSALLAESLEIVRAAGQAKLLLRVVGGDDSEGFAQARGGRVIERETLSGLDLSTIDRGAFDLWAAPTTTGAGYTLIRWSDHCPEELAESFCDAMTAMADAPGDVSSTPLTVEKLREKEQALVRFGIHRHFQAALAADGQIAGFTNVVTLEKQPGPVEIWNTGVVRAHRGHRLAQRLKAAATLWILDAYPQSTWIFTHNHVANAPMLAVNRRLGYQPIVEWVKVEFPVS